METGPVKDLIGIDIADPGQEALVEKQGFDSTPLPPHHGLKLPFSQFQRFGPQRGYLRRIVRQFRKTAKTVAEFAYIPEEYSLARSKEKDQMDMFIRTFSPSNNLNLPRHFEMEGQAPAGIKTDQQQLPSPSNSGNRSPRQPIKTFRRSPNQVG